MWRYNIRSDSNGEGIPHIQKVPWSFCPGAGEIWEYGVSWDVTYPDPSKACGFSCCGLTESKMFDTWAEALAFALARSWAQ